MSAACHTASATQVDLESAGVERRLVGKASTSAMCRDLVYVSTDGSASLILDKLEDDPPCGTKMPIGPPLSATDTACLNDWVDSLAR